MPGNEWEKRVYFHHTGYVGGASWTFAHELHKKDPTLVRLIVIQKLLQLTISSFIQGASIFSPLAIKSNLPVWFINLEVHYLLIFSL